MDKNPQECPRVATIFAMAGDIHITDNEIGTTIWKGHETTEPNHRDATLRLLDRLEFQLRQQGYTHVIDDTTADATTLQVEPIADMFNSWRTHVERNYDDGWQSLHGGLQPRVQPAKGEVGRREIHQHPD